MNLIVINFYVINDVFWCLDEISQMKPTTTFKAFLLYNSVMQPEGVQWNI